jgi:hypothetical protein
VKLSGMCHHVTWEGFHQGAVTGVRVWSWQLFLAIVPGNCSWQLFLDLLEMTSSTDGTWSVDELVVGDVTWICLHTGSLWEAMFVAVAGSGQGCAVAHQSTNKAAFVL